MKKHLVELEAKIYVSIYVDGDETPKEAEEYVLKNINFSCTLDDKSEEILEVEQMTILDSYEERESP